MKKIVFSACMLLSAVLAFNSINKNKVNVFNDNVEALSMKEFNFGIAYLICKENTNEECYAILPEYDPVDPKIYVGVNGMSYQFNF